LSWKSVRLVGNIARDINKDSRLKDKDRDKELEFMDRNHKLSTYPAFIMQQKQITLGSGVVRILCINAIFSSCVA